MEIRFEGAGPDGEDDLRSLYRWLTDDASLRDDIDIEAVKGDDPGRMGPSMEAVLAVISTLATLGQLPFSFAAWRQQRRPERPVSVTVLGASAQEIETVLRSMGVEQAEQPRQLDGGESEREHREGQR